LRKVGLFFGSFNPIHTGHLIIAEYMLQALGLEKVIFVVSPQNPFKGNQELWSENFRLELVEKAVEDNPRFEVSDIEFHLPKPSYTYLTLEQLKIQYPDYSFSLILGSDNLIRLNEWKNIEAILSSTFVEVYQRPNTKLVESFHKNIRVHQTPFIDISSTFIRNSLLEGKSVKYLVPNSILPLLENLR